MPRIIVFLTLASLLVGCVSSTTTSTQPTGSTSLPIEVTALPVEATPQPATDTSVPAQPAAADTAVAATSESPQALTGLPGVGGVVWRTLLEGLDNPVGLANAGDGSGRLFILEQPGRIRIMQGGSLLPTPFLDISDKVDCCGERGLLGLAFHPQYSENGYFYINYTTLINDQLTTIIARIQVSADPNLADPGSEKVLISQEQPFSNHNGGGLVFGPDGYLYIGLGDGGSAGDPNGNGQSVQTLLGKLLRIDVDNGDPYAIPADNPFANGGGLPEIWAYGLRNPWRFSFDRLTGDLFIGDVGQGDWEEIDYLPAGSPGGANFGWNYYEGNHPYQGTPPPGVDFVFPVAEYGHGPDISVTGGIVYRGTVLPNWNGVYLYGDYGSGRVRGLVHLEDGSWQDGILFELNAQIASFGEDEYGEVYLTDYSGNLLRLEASGQSYLPITPKTAASETQQTITFAVFGDYGNNSDHEADVAVLVQSWQPDLVISTGDNNYPHGGADTIDGNIGKYYRSYIYPYLGDYGDGSDINRFFPTLGNHDWQTDDAQAYLDYFALPGNERYYSFTWGPVSFFAIDNDTHEPDGVDSNSIQAQWLQESLSASTSPWNIVFMHYSPYSSSEHGSTDWAQWPYGEWGADAVLSGHDHVYERLMVDNLPYFVSGLGGGSIYGFVDILPESVVRYNTTWGALRVEASEDKLTFRFYSIDGDLVDSFEIVQ